MNRCGASLELVASKLGWGGIDWQGEGLYQTGLHADTGATLVRIDPCYFRLAEVEILLGDPIKDREELDWTPATTLEELVAEMVAAAREDAKKESYLKYKGFQLVGSMENPPTNPEVIAAAARRDDGRHLLATALQQVPEGLGSVGNVCVPPFAE
jgi:GDPmannose 4,6-dehydratase